MEISLSMSISSHGQFSSLACSQCSLSRSITELVLLEGNHPLWLCIKSLMAEWLEQASR